MEAIDSQQGSFEPQSMMQALAAVMDKLESVCASQEAEREEMRSQIRILQTAVSRTPTPANEPVAPIEPMSDNTPQSIETSERIPSKRVKPTLPDPPKFDGTRKNFRPWFLEMKAKLAVDRQAFDNKEALFAYVYSRLAGTAQNMAAAYYEQGGIDGARSPELFLDYLNRRYGDPNAKARALDRLRSLKQKPDESFASFFPKFEKELADSGGGEWADVVQINYLEGAINNRLKSSLVSAVSLPKDFNSYAELLLTIGSRLDSLNFHERQQSREQRPKKEYGRSCEPLESRQKPPSPGSPTMSPDPSDDQMDWEPVKANRLINGRRAPEGKQFVPLEERRCYECGKLGHIAVNCSRNKRQQQKTKFRVEEKTKSSRAKHQEPAESSSDEASDECSENE
ncbi:hypothetical protein HIM_11830 [Hirsutella minnesotensis 3608]|uniref:CCHC-type domain-containing protein n=1 Tax=Hirsutella minnesotensis 3608 TaxID=1043627 RepID=A0A0F7ZFA2_9HYPO|nr:hypothetical protein HIM_11830 [Hirsutella minnesotensis 3608]